MSIFRVVCGEPACQNTGPWAYSSPEAARLATLAGWWPFPDRSWCCPLCIPRLDARPDFVVERRDVYAEVVP